LKAIRVAFVINSMGRGGAETMLLKLASRMDRRAFGIQIISVGGDGSLRKDFAELDCDLRIVESRLGSYDPMRLVEVVRALRGFSPTLIQGWMYHGNIAASLAGRLLSRSIPVLWNVRGTNVAHQGVKWRSRVLATLSGPLAPTASVIINNSLTSAKIHEQVLRYPPSKRVIIPNGFDLTRFRPDERAGREVRAQLAIPELARIIGFVGRDHPDKDVPNFVTAATTVLGQRADTIAVLAGAGLDATSRHARSLPAHLKSQFRFAGPQEAPRLMAALDVLVSPSVRENFPNVVGEAMSCSVPVVVTDVGDCRRLVGATGLAVPPSNSEALARAIGTLLEMPLEQLRALGRAARERIETTFSLAEIVRQYETLYASVADGKGIPSWLREPWRPTSTEDGSAGGVPGG
jgi:glycosyltransferase involved in cell wall biosynthesis